MVKITSQIGLVQTVAQCIKDAEGTAEKIKEQYPRLRSRDSKRGAKKSLEFFEAVVYHLKRLQQLESGALVLLAILACLYFFCFKEGTTPPTP